MALHGVGLSSGGGGGGGGTPAGSNTEVQYNNSGAFGASSALTFDSIAGRLSSTILRFGGAFDLQKNANSNGFGIGSGYGGLAASQGSNTIGIGVDVLNGATSSYNQGVFIGNETGKDTNNLFNSVAIGFQALKDADAGSSVTAVGCQAGQNGGGQNSTFVGYITGQNSSGVGNSFFGAISGTQIVGNGNTAVGYNCLYSATSSESVAIGFASLANITGALSQAIGIGYYALVEANNVTTSVAIGSSVARAVQQLEESVLIGGGAGQYSTTIDNCLYLGTNTGQYSEALKTVAIGSNAFSQSKADFVTAIGDNAGASTQGDSAVYIGQNSGQGATQAPRSTFISPESGFSAFSARESVFIGYRSGYESSYAYNSSFIGGNSGYSAPTAAHSIFIGDNAGYDDAVVNKTTGVISVIKTNSFFFSGTNLNVGDIGTVSSGDANATIEIMEIEDGQIQSVLIQDGGTQFSVGESIFLTSGTGGELSVATIDGEYKPIDTVSLGSSGGTGYTVSDQLFILGDEFGAALGQVNVDSIDGIMGEVASASIDQAGIDYVVSDQVSLIGGDNNASLTIDTVGGLGEVLTYTLNSGGTGYSDGVYEALNTGGSFAGTGLYFSVTVYLGQVTAISLVAQGKAYNVGSDNAVFGGTGTGCLINVDSIGSTLGIVTGVTIVNAGSQYDVTTNAPYTNGLYGIGLEIDIDAIALGTAKTIALVSGGTGYEVGGYAGENTVTGIGDGNLQIYIDEISSPVVTGTSIAIGRYSGTGGFSKSIAVGHGVINSAVSQLNIGNVLYGTGIYGDDTQDGTPIVGGKIGIGTATPQAELDVAGEITTDAGANKWKLKGQVTASVSFDGTQHLEVDINGTTYKLALAT